MSPSNRPAWSMPATGGPRACAWGRSGGGGTGWGRYEFGAQLIVMLLLLLGANCAMAAAADPTGSLYFLRLDALDFDIQAALPDELSVYEGHQTQSAPEDPSYGPLHFDPVAERVATDIHPFPVDATSSPLTPLYAQDRDDAAGSELSVWEERLVLDPHSVELHYHIDGRLAGQVDAGADTDAPLFVSPMQLMDEIQLVIDGIYWPGLSNPPGPDQDL
ncbi:MAG: hypothetical protein KDK91_10140, partial [Gammaproteobacteria bacterium]|nr:hypothetical protein [Gammaproteobacteria bacterium]